MVTGTCAAFLDRLYGVCAEIEKYLMQLIGVSFNIIRFRRETDSFLDHFIGGPLKHGEHFVDDVENIDACLFRYAATRQ